MEHHPLLLSFLLSFSVFLISFPSSNLLSLSSFTSFLVLSSPLCCSRPLVSLFVLSSSCLLLSLLPSSTFPVFRHLLPMPTSSCVLLLSSCVLLSSSCVLLFILCPPLLILCPSPHLVASSPHFVSFSSSSHFHPCPLLSSSCFLSSHFISSVVPPSLLLSCPLLLSPADRSKLCAEDWRLCQTVRCWHTDLGADALRDAQMSTRLVKKSPVERCTTYLQGCFESSEATSETSAAATGEASAALLPPHRLRTCSRYKLTPAVL